MPIWDDVITERDKQVYEKAGFGRKVSFGKKPALVIIDVNYNFVGDRPEPILKSIERFPLSCGEDGWKAVYEIASLLPLAREKQIPIIYSNPDPLTHSGKPGIWTTEHIPAAVKAGKVDIGNEIPREIAPTENDIVIYKVAPSIFHGTHIMSVLIPLGIDTLLFCGVSTSGCVRASVVDAASLGFRVGVIEKCTFDRGEATHKINLFDMNAKYANVVSVSEVKDYLNKL